MLEAGAPETELWLQQLEHAPDATALSDASGTVLAANPAYLRTLRYGPDEVLGRNFALIFPNEQRATAQVQYGVLKADPSTANIPVILMSAAHSRASAISSADAVIAKPFDLDILDSLIRAAPDASLRAHG